MADWWAGALGFGPSPATARLWVAPVHFYDRLGRDRYTSLDNEMYETSTVVGFHIKITSINIILKDDTAYTRRMRTNFEIKRLQ